MSRDPASLSELLDKLYPESNEGALTLSDLLARIGARSFAPVLLVPSLLLVSPLSAIPGAPTTGMLVIVTITLQALFGRRHLWLPQFITRREISARRLRAGIDWLRSPVRWVDRRTKNRWRLLTHPPLDRIPLITILIITLPWPILEPLPMVTSIGAFAVTLFALGMMVRDGVWILAGYLFVGGLGLAIINLWQELF